MPFSFNNFIDAKEEIYNLLSKTYNKTSLIKLVLVGEVSSDFNIDVKSLTHLLNEYFYYENSIRNQRNLKELKREKYWFYTIC